MKKGKASRLMAALLAAAFLLALVIGVSASGYGGELTSFAQAADVGAESANTETLYFNAADGRLMLGTLSDPRTSSQPNKAWTLIKRGH